VSEGREHIMKDHQSAKRMICTYKYELCKSLSVPQEFKDACALSSFGSWHIYH